MKAAENNDEPHPPKIPHSAVINFDDNNHDKQDDKLNVPQEIPHSALINSDNDDHDDEIQELPDPKTSVTRKSQVSFLEQPPAS